MSDESTSQETPLSELGYERYASSIEVREAVKDILAKIGGSSGLFGPPPSLSKANRYLREGWKCGYCWKVFVERPVNDFDWVTAEQLETEVGLSTLHPPLTHIEAHVQFHVEHALQNFDKIPEQYQNELIGIFTAIEFEKKIGNLGGDGLRFTDGGGSGLSITGGAAGYGITVTGGLASTAGGNGIGGPGWKP